MKGRNWRSSLFRSFQADMRTRTPEEERVAAGLRSDDGQFGVNHDANVVKAMA